MDVDPERVRLEEQRLETMEDEGNKEPRAGGSGGDDGCGAGSSYGNDSGEQLSVIERAQRYIAKHKKNPSNNKCDPNVALSNVASTDIVPPASSNPTYEAIYNLRLKDTEAQSLNGGETVSCNNLGSFKPSGGAWGGPPIQRNVFGKRQNLSFNFDPVTMLCKSCGDPEHRILSGGRGILRSVKSLF
jgi:hypothetical protein